MRVELTRHKAMLYNGIYYMSIWNSGDIHCIKEENGKLKDSNFNVKDNLIFDKMFQNFVKHDYQLIA
jgi:hypothetical protein